jgi:A/G-specific adenine glycosylase
LLDWYDRTARELAWRVGPAARRAGRHPDPYAVWLSEVMLQQTTVPHATPYFHAFVARWPSVEDLAAAEDAEVMQAWAGLGYYARARSLLACARAVAARGGFPTTAIELQGLPGIGPYTAAAVAAIAFDEAVCPVDGNVERVLTRVRALDGPWPAVKAEVTALAQTLTDPARPGDFAQALMDLGATVCTPRTPGCLVCPVAAVCVGRARGAPERFPVKPPRPDQPWRYGQAWLLTSPDRLLRVTRPPDGLLGGMAGLPGPEWTTVPGDAGGGGWAAPHGLQAERAVRLGEVRHVFTHFRLKLSVLQVSVTEAQTSGLTATFGAGAHWVERASAARGLPTVFAKAVRLWPPGA